MALVSGQPIGDGLWKLPGEDIFGVEWVVECADPASLEPIKPLYQAIKTTEDEQTATSTALSGSAAYLGRMNPFPADVDFNEIVLVKAASITDAAKIFVDKLKGNIKSILCSDTMKFSELKIGGNPYTGKGYKWDLAEIWEGRKTGNGEGSEDEPLISLTDAALQRQMIKIDFVAKIDGNWKELTKTCRFAYQPLSGENTEDIEVLAPENLSETIYQELFFSEAEARLAAKISEASEGGGFSNPEVMKKYRDLMDVEIAHYGALGTADNISHLKLLKRWFNKVRMARDRSSIERLGRVFGSEINSAHEITEMMRIAVLAIEKNLLGKYELLDQLGRFMELLQQRDLKMPIEFRNECDHRLESAQELLEEGDFGGCAEQLGNLSSSVEGWIEERAKEHLLDQILRPYAEGLGIKIREDGALDQSDLFKEVDHGDRMNYLVTNYLRDDSRVVKREFEKGDKIIRFGDEANCCFILLSGFAVVTDPGQNRVSSHIRDMGPFTLIGEIGLIHSGQRRTAEITASTQVEALEIPQAVFLELMNYRSFRLFIRFLSTDRLLEDRARDTRGF